ncbi:glycerophosphodiester phosphodiesterase family protein [Virgibacillus sp. 179-BFC.A HS]|uniref:Glycerophosphodiester phosphodiesterase family protein n=1 Tax=Tigheibacillus jepli TaxID=3035914 RepID=A0ABU5CEI5_9BACI|nr:glycerophosphodiester phosphodiesterase family protein [Virgibacillus sp. 179-BFC.A HS]MDY0404747.1 glycerophosphodiester phosphodiesterase family protein [Virgibacillus sp. 179-BFC.A HS]
MVLNFAHRGSLTEAPENTLSSIKKAVAHKAKGIELDVQLTKDNHLVVIHDHRFKRFNKNYGLVQAYTLAEIKQIDVGSSFSKEFAGEPLATLAEILEIVPRNTILNIEIKNIPVIYPGIEETLIHCLAEHDRMDHILISSFDHVALKKVQELDPDIPIGMLFYYRLLEPWKYAKNSGLRVASIHPNVVYTDKAFIAACHRYGYKVFPFTVNRMSQYRKLVEWGVDGVFSNNPEIFTQS